MPDLEFQVEGVEAAPFAASPLLIFKLRINHNTEDAANILINTIALRCQIRLEPTKRRYDAAEQGGLLDLFGEPHRWGQTLRSMLWAHTSIVVPPFSGSTTVDLPVPCTYDFNVATTKYFDALSDGEVPLCLLFSGTVFFEVTDGPLQVAQVPWEKETDFRLPVRVWKEMMDHYYPNTAWLCLRKDMFDRLHRYKRQHGLPTWEQALAVLLGPENGQAPP
jgi:hypothetical protein